MELVQLGIALRLVAAALQRRGAVELICCIEEGQAVSTNRIDVRLRLIIVSQRDTSASLPCHSHDDEQQQGAQTRDESLQTDSSRSGAAETRGEARVESTMQSRRRAKQHANKLRQQATSEGFAQNRKKKKTHNKKGQAPRKIERFLPRSFQLNQHHNQP